MSIHKESRWKKVFAALRPLEYAFIAFYGIMSALCILYANRVEYWYLFVLLNATIAGFIILLGDKIIGREGKFFKVISYWYPAPLLLLTFKEIYFLVHSIRGSGIQDGLLIEIDFAVFGFHPTQALYHYAHPLLTEILQIAYASFYFLPMILGVALYFQGKIREAEYVIFSVVFGFFLSYIGYFIFPAVGPRFTLHDFYTTDAELPGIFLTTIIRDILNIGESIPPGTKEAILYVQRDVFPSGHTMMTAMVMYFAVKYSSRHRVFLLITGALLIFATVYLRYHYVVDVVGGLVFLLFSLVLGKWFFSAIESAKNTKFSKRK